MESAAGIPARYGHACAGCSRAKCRCIMRAGGNCERCHRLGKECTPSETVRSRGRAAGARRTTSSTSRRSQLEDKLGDLVSLLQGQHALPSNDHTSRNQDSVLTALSLSRDPPSVRNATESVPRDPPVYDLPYHTPPSIASGSRSIPNNPPVSNNGAPPVDTYSQLDAERHLHMFRTAHLKSLPLVHLPDQMTASDLQRERPFLWLNIRAVCTESHAAQAELGMRIRNTLSTKLIIEGERSVDLLLGLLVFTAWAYSFFRGKPMLGINTGLIKSIITDLHLDRPSGENIFVQDGPVSAFACHKIWTLVDPISNFGPRTDEERRALLASFVLTVTLCLSTGHPPMPWGPQMDEAVVQLSNNCSHSGDEMLVALARISKVSDDTSTLIRLGYEFPERLGPPLLAIKLLRSSLEQVRTLLSPEVLQDKTVLSHLYCAEVMIYELALFQMPPKSYTEPIEHQRFVYLHTCLRAINSSLKNFLEIDEVELCTTCFSPWLHFSHYMLALQRLSCLQHPAWDRNLVRAEVDVLVYLEKAATKMEQASLRRKTSDPGYDIGVLEKGASVLRASLPVWAASLEKTDTPPTDENNNDEDDPMRHVVDPSMTGFMDETWFADALSWNF